MAEVKYLDLTGLQRYDQKIKEVVNTGLDAKADKTEVESSLALKADKTEVESSLALKADKTEVDQKIGKDDAMLVTESSNTVSAYLDGSNFVEVSDESWYVKITPNDQAQDYKFSIIDGESVIFEKSAVSLNVYRNRPEDRLGANYIKIKYFSYSTGNNEEIIEVTNDTLKFGCEIDGNVEITSFANNLTRNTKESFEYLNNTLSTKITAEDLPTAVSQLSNDAGYAVAGDLKISEVTEGLGENVAKAYKFEGGAESAVIEIPKDQTLKSVELGKIVNEAFVVDPTGEILRFTYIIADGSEKVVDVNVSNLITEAELDPVYDLIDTKLDAADVLTVSNDEIDAMFT